MIIGFIEKVWISAENAVRTNLINLKNFNQTVLHKNRVIINRSHYIFTSSLINNHKILIVIILNHSDQFFIIF